MSGIAGIIHFDGAPVEPGQIEKMTSAMAYRGPDGIRHWVRGSVALGQCMLRTTPESLEETQPLSNEDESLVLVMDGRVDNWEELRRELLGHGAVLRTRADAELVLRAYEAWGRDCLAHIDGDFALVVWDARKRQAFCARDRLGNKPFNYQWDGSTLTFASELLAILKLPWVEQTFNEGMLAEFLAAEWLSRNETFWQGILRLEAAHCMEVGALGPSPKAYWSPDLWMTLPCTKVEDYVERYRALFADVVRRMSRSHLPLACEVSGGLDSSAIFAMAVDLSRKKELPAPGIEGYTLDFRGDPDADELEYCRAVGEYLGRKIQEIPPSRMPLSWYRDWARRHGEFPGYPNGIMGLGIREKARFDGSSTLLVGVGGDEWLDGARTYYAEALATRSWCEFSSALSTDRQEAGLRTSLGWVLRYGFYPLLPDSFRSFLRNAFTAGRIEGFDRERWLVPAMRHMLQERRTRYRETSPERPRRIGQRAQLRILQGAYSMLARESEERLASSVSVELRRPYWNADLVQFSFATPERFRSKGQTDKLVHRSAMAGLLPERVLRRTTKATFMTIFRQQLPSIAEWLLRKHHESHADWLVPSSVPDLYQQCERKEHSGWPEWMLWTLFGCVALMPHDGGSNDVHTG